MSVLNYSVIVYECLCTMLMFCAADALASPPLLTSRPSMTLGNPLLSAIACSPDGKYLVAGAQSGMAVLWDIRDKAIVKTFDVVGYVGAVAFSPDSKRLYTTSRDGEFASVRIWDVETGALIKKFGGHKARIVSLAISPDGRKALTGGDDGVVKLWDIESGKKIAMYYQYCEEGFRLYDDDILVSTGGPCPADVAFSPDGARFAMNACNGLVLAYSTAPAQNDEPLDYSAALLKLAASDYDANVVAFSPDGAHILTGGSDGAVKLWNAATGEMAREFKKANGDVRRVGFSPDGAKAFAAYSCYEETAVKAWDVATGELIASYFEKKETKDDAYWVTPIRQIFCCIGNDGSQVFTASERGGIHIWNAADGKLTDTFGKPGCEVIAVAFSPDGAMAMTAAGNAIHLWNADDGALIKTISWSKCQINCAVFSPDGSKILVGGDDSKSVILDVKSGNVITRLAGLDFDEELKYEQEHPEKNALRHYPGHICRVDLVAYCPDGATVITRARDCTSTLWDSATGKYLGAYPGSSLNGSKGSLAFSPDGHCLLTAHECGNGAALWSYASDKPLLHFEQEDGGIFAPDGSKILLGSDKEAFLFNAETGELIRKYPLKNSIFAFSPDGLRILGLGEKGMILIDAADGGTIQAFETETDCLAFAPDGKRVITGSSDGVARIWAVQK